MLGGRFKVLSEILERAWVRVLLAIWGLSGVYDLALSEWVPEQYAKHLPRVYQVVAMTTGLLPWQLWVLIGALIIAAASVEYAYRHKQQLVAALSKQAPGPATPSEQPAKELPRKAMSPSELGGLIAIGIFSVTAVLLIAIAGAYDLIKSRQPQVSTTAPWASAQEIADQQKRGRTLLAIGPADLVALYVKNGYGAITPYQDSWVKIDNVLDHLKRDPLVTSGIDPAILRIAGFSVPQAFFVAYFGHDTERGKVLQLVPGDRVHALCRFNKIEMGYDESLYAVRVFGNTCEFN